MSCRPGIKIVHLTRTGPFYGRCALGYRDFRESSHVGVSLFVLCTLCGVGGKGHRSARWGYGGLVVKRMWNNGICLIYFVLFALGCSPNCACIFSEYEFLATFNFKQDR